MHEWRKSFLQHDDGWIPTCFENKQGKRFLEERVARKRIRVFNCVSAARDTLYRAFMPSISDANVWHDRIATHCCLFAKSYLSQVRVGAEIR